MREMHVKCTYNGIPLLEIIFSKDWKTNDLQVKILFPFCVPWWRSKLWSHRGDPKEKKTHMVELVICNIFPFSNIYHK